MSSPPLKCTLYPVFAAGSPKAVIYRRGPSNRTCVIAWDRSDDSFQVGQWFKGMVKPGWGGLSPNGEWLVTFLGKHRGPFSTYTVLSRPPYLTAIALWPMGHTWAGGGFFPADDTLVLMHGDDSCAPALSPPQSLTVVPFTRANAAMLTSRIESDPWRPNPGDEGGRIATSAQGHALIMTGANLRDDPGLSLQERVPYLLRVRGRASLPLPVSGWTAFDGNGDLLFSQGGALFRLRADAIDGLETPDALVARSRCLADFTDLRFRPLAAPYAPSGEDGFLPPLDGVSREDRRLRMQARKVRPAMQRSKDRAG